MEVLIEFCEGVISRRDFFEGKHPEGGAVVEFYGRVRGSERGAVIRGLRYEIYERMADLQARRVLSELAVEFPCLQVVLVHRHGVVEVGEAAVYVGVLASHRQQAFGMLSAFMDRLKQEVPIWKAEVLAC